MKNVVAILASFLLIGVGSAMAQSLIQFSSNVQTDLYPTEAAAFNQAITVSSQINSGKNQVALGDAAIECPSDNNPTFKVSRIKLETYWLSSAGSASEKKYSAQINYTITCRRS